MPRSCASATIERRITGRVPLPFARTNDWSILIMSNGKRCRRSEEHTSELQSLRHLVCRLLLEKKLHYPHALQRALSASRHWHRLVRRLPAGLGVRHRGGDREYLGPPPVIDVRLVH